MWVGTSLDGVIKKIIYIYKFERAQDNAKVMAQLLLQTLPELPSGVLITYIPTASSRVRQRGYDHAKLLANAYARLQHRRAIPLLRRFGQARQVGASRTQRVTQLKDAFAVRDKSKVSGKRILLIDDIVTTGATLNAAANILLAAGAQSVDALVVARKQ